MQNADWILSLDKHLINIYLVFIEEQSSIGCIYLYY